MGRFVARDSPAVDALVEDAVAKIGAEIEALRESDLAGVVLGGGYGRGEGGVFVEGGEVCVGRVAPLPSQLIDTTKEDLEETVSDACEELPTAYLAAAMAAHAVTGAESVRCDALTFCMEPSQRRMRVCHVRGVCRM